MKRIKGLCRRLPMVLFCAGLAGLGRAEDLAVRSESYLVVDLSGGPSAAKYPVTHLKAVPAGGWADEYKTKKMVLRHVPAGTFLMGSPPGELGRYVSEAQHQVTLSRGYYIGVFEVTQKQWERVMGDWPSYFNNASHRDSRPVEQVSYNDVRGPRAVVAPDHPFVIPRIGSDDMRGPAAGAGWPLNNSVEATSFLGRLRARTGQAFDLPTEAQWEYACRAGTGTSLNCGKNLTNTRLDADMTELGRYWYNGGSGFTQKGSTALATAEAGSYRPNAWGLYDMHGNVWEWCLDWYGAYPGAAASDPQGASSGTHRVDRGGSWSSDAYGCRSADRDFDNPDYRTFLIGFRVVLPLGAR